MKILSLVIPIFNMDKYLKSCLDSIIEQISDTEEIILVNDGSVDNSAEICNNYSEKNNNIYVIHQENEGISSARNSGLKKASGKYIAWVDADDWIACDYIDYIKKIIMDNNTDIIIFDYCKVFERKREFSFYQNKSMYLEKDKIMLDLATDVRLPSSLWRIVARKELYDKIEFPFKIQMMEDFAVFHHLFHRAESYFYLRKNLYFYRIRSDSLSHVKEQNVIKRYDIAVQRKKFYEKYYPHIEEKYTIIPVLLNGCNVLEHLAGERAICDEIKTLLYKYFWSMIREKKMPMRKKIQIILCVVNPLMAKFIKKVVWEYERNKLDIPIAFYSTAGVSSSKTKELIEEYIDIMKRKKISRKGISTFIIQSRFNMFGLYIKEILKKLSLFKFLMKRKGWQEHRCHNYYCRWCKMNAKLKTSRLSQLKIRI